MAAGGAQGAGLAVDVPVQDTQAWEIRALLREPLADDGLTERALLTLARALIAYVADRCNRSAAGLTYDLVDDLLSAHGIEAPLRARLRSCVETCDYARFVPSASDTARRDELLAEAGQVIEELERAW